MGFCPGPLKDSVFEEPVKFNYEVSVEKAQKPRTSFRKFGETNLKKRQETKNHEFQEKILNI